MCMCAHALSRNSLILSLSAPLGADSGTALYYLSGPVNSKPITHSASKCTMRRSSQVSQSVCVCVGAHCSPSLSRSATRQHNKQRWAPVLPASNTAESSRGHRDGEGLELRPPSHLDEVAHISGAPTAPPPPHCRPAEPLMSTQNQMKHCIHFPVSLLHWRVNEIKPYASQWRATISGAP